MKTWTWNSRKPIQTMGDAESFFLARKTATHCSPNTLAAYDADIRTICKEIARLYEELPGGRPEDIPVSYLTPDVLTDAFQAYAGTHALTSHHRCYSTWFGMCNTLAINEKLDMNPMIRVDKPRPPNAPLPKTYNRTALHQLIDYLNDPHEEDSATRWASRDRAAILILLATGERAGELRATNIGDCSPAPDGSGAIIFRIRGKGEKERLATIEASVASAVTDYLFERCMRNPEQVPHLDANDPWATLPGNAPLIIDNKGNRMSKATLEYRVKRALKRSGAWSSGKAAGTLVHQFRHTFATQLADDPSVTAFQLQRLLGHASLTATQKYTGGAGRLVREVASHNPVYGMLDGKPEGSNRVENEEMDR
jgi:integrase/recombinase XerC